MSTSYQKLFMVECYVWLMAGCVIEESRGLASANGFALMNGMGCPSRVPKRTHLKVYEKEASIRDGLPSIRGLSRGHRAPRHGDVLVYVEKTGNQVTSSPNEHAA